MTFDDSALWLIWSVGFGMGFAYRVWNERRAARHKPAAWIGTLGEALAAQIYRVDEGHRFAGDETIIVNKALYGCNGKRFVVRVEREPRLTTPSQEM